MSRQASRSLIAFALLALGWAQVFGLTRGYWCDCSGAGHVSMFDHCHGHHGTSCHHDEIPLHSHEDHDDGGETHEHAPVKESLDAQTLVLTVLSVPSELPVEFLPDFVATVARNGQASGAPARPPRPAVDELRQWPRVLSHAVVLRI